MFIFNSVYIYKRAKEPQTICSLLKCLWEPDLGQAETRDKHSTGAFPGGGKDPAMWAVTCSLQGYELTGTGAEVDQGGEQAPWHGGAHPSTYTPHILQQTQSMAHLEEVTVFYIQFTFS